MNPGKLNLICPQGATFSKSFQVYDKNDVAMDLTGYTAVMQAREAYTSDSYLFSLSTGNGITISGNEIVVTIHWSATNEFPPGKYVWDLEITSAADKRDRLVEGSLTVTPGVTR